MAEGGIPAFHERLRREVGVGELRLLQAHDVRLVTIEQREEPRQPLPEGVHVPRHDAHPRKAIGSETRASTT
jgi:hypothetical protein